MQHTWAGTKWALILWSLLAAGCQAQTPGAPAERSGWRSECVGQYQLDLPRDFKPTEREFDQAVGDLVSGSEDGTELPVASGSNVTEAQFQHLKSDIHEGYMGKKKVALNDADTLSGMERGRQRKDYADGIKPYPLNVADAFAWHNGDAIDGYFYRAGRIYAISGPPEGKAETGESTFEEKIKLFRPRELFEVPSGPGLCLPFAFIGTTFRGTHNKIFEGGTFASHPDVMLWVGNRAWWDKKCPGCDERQSSDENKKQSRDNLKMFWEQMPKEKQIRALGWPFPSVKMADYEGYASFIQITRRNGDVDYGYRAVTDPQGGFYALDVYLLQRSSIAHEKNVTPMTKDEFKRLADGIAASLRKRE